MVRPMYDVLSSFPQAVVVHSRPVQMHNYLCYYIALCLSLSLWIFSLACTSSCLLQPVSFIDHHVNNWRSHQLMFSVQKLNCSDNVNMDICFVMIPVFGIELSYWYLEGGESVCVSTIRHKESLDLRYCAIISYSLPVYFNTAINTTLYYWTLLINLINHFDAVSKYIIICLWGM